MSKLTDLEGKVRLKLLFVMHLFYLRAILLKLKFLHNLKVFYECIEFSSAQKPQD